MFLGTTNNCIDAKNRMFVPAKMRTELGSECVMTIGIDKCLYIYAMSDFEEYAKKLTSLSELDEDTRRFVRKVFSNAERCDVDKQGRITIPATLREYADIEKELVTIGNFTRIEVWAKDVLEKIDSTGLSQAELAQKLGGNGI